MKSAIHPSHFVKILLGVTVFQRQTRIKIEWFNARKHRGPIILLM